ncbi:MAG: hypothetical protein CMJ64_19240 [Planctomycetaceae bacterium]|nr:hypothetical protein [Planctomycetaceae bacterium]
MALPLSVFFDPADKKFKMWYLSGYVAWHGLVHLVLHVHEVSAFVDWNTSLSINVMTIDQQTRLDQSKPREQHSTESDSDRARESRVPPSTQARASSISSGR